MSWPASLIIDLFDKQNSSRWEQLEFDFPQMFYIDISSVTGLRTGLCYSVGKNMYGSVGTVDHPHFTELRNHLESKKLIKTQRNWSNGDSVLKPFYLNEIYFEHNDQFASASAMSYTLRKGNDKPPKFNKD